MMPDQSLAGLTILIVEDEYFIADDFARLLAASGATILGPAATVDQATGILDQHQPDLAVLDINLRGETVFPFADALRTRNIPFLFATGYDAGVIPRAYEAVPRHGKPVRAETILSALHGLRGAATK